MRAVDLITKKRDGGELTQAEIAFFVEGLTSGVIPDYQVAAWAMAVFFRGMTARETTYLTLAMAASGDLLDLSDTVKLAVDKHSTGGVGDKVTLVVEPLVASCGVPMGKMSGRGLGFSGGTIDKLESIPGFRTALTTAEFKAQLKRIGVVLTGQSGNLTPADGKLYALRDVTGTVNSIPLIASSVMSKKIAGGAQAIVLDVKVGTGAFMPTVAEAVKLADAMVAIGRHAQRRTVALIADMNQPLGHAVGNALEVREAIDTLHGGGPADFREHCLVVAAHLLVLARHARGLPAARAELLRALDGGAAWAKFKQLVAAQGGDVDAVEHPERLPAARFVEVVPAPRSGILSRVDAREIGLSSVDLGAGRATKADKIDHAVGLVIHHKVGDHIRRGEPLFTVHANAADRLAAARSRVLAAHRIGARAVQPLPLFYKTLKSH
ncbi:MAG: pyrimidine-nucleoside phosphorylase [Anaerolineales bacterium]|nr:pyrimidine-nucleoside phosphorylase [Anaerolineales bacterium]